MTRIIQVSVGIAWLLLSAAAAAELHETQTQNPDKPWAENKPWVEAWYFRNAKTKTAFRIPYNLDFMCPSPSTSDGGRSPVLTHRLFRMVDLIFPKSPAVILTRALPNSPCGQFHPKFCQEQLSTLVQDFICPLDTTKRIMVQPNGQSDLKSDLRLKN